MTRSLSKSAQPARGATRQWGSGHYGHWKDSIIRRMFGFFILASVACGLFALGRMSAQSDPISAEPCASGDGRLAQLHEHNASLRERVVMLERTAEVERAAYRRVGQSLRQLQNEVLRLTEELAIYKAIVVRGDFKKGISIQSLKLNPEEQAGLYRYQVVLTHFSADRDMVSAVMELSVSGTQGGKTSVLSLAELVGTERESREIHLRFRNFVKVEGVLHLPQDFAPRYVQVRVDGEAEQQRTIEKTFTWQQATG